MDVTQLVTTLLANPSVRDKVLIERTYALNGDTVQAGETPVRLGDDCAAIPDGHGGYTLFAAEGLIETFVTNEPWFAGYSAVMVNISDICAMGGLPTALTNVIWAKDPDDSTELWEGMLAACEAFNIPMVGGHTCYNSTSRHLAVSIIGRAQQLLTSFDARPGDALVMAIDMDGAYFKNYPFWNASTHKSSTQNQRSMRLLHDVANDGLAVSCKDISMGGIIGTLHMLTRTSQVGAFLDVDAVPIPDGVPVEKWLTSFPSFGYLLTTPQHTVSALVQRFTENDIQAGQIGTITPDPQIQLRYQNQTALFTQQVSPETTHPTYA